MSGWNGGGKSLKAKREKERRKSKKWSTDTKSARVALLAFSKHARRDIKGEGVQAFYSSWELPYQKQFTPTRPCPSIRLVTQVKI